MACLTLPKAAKRLGVSESTLRRWCEEGRVSVAKKLPGSRWLIEEWAVIDRPDKGGTPAGRQELEARNGLRLDA